jgi:hypothetical protein
MIDRLRHAAGLYIQIAEHADGVEIEGSSSTIC